MTNVMLDVISHPCGGWGWLLISHPCGGSDFSPILVGCDVWPRWGVVMSHPYWGNVMSHPIWGGAKCCLTHVRGGEILNAPLLIHLNSSGLSIYYLATKTHTFHENNVELPPPGKSWIRRWIETTIFNILLFKNKSNEIGKQSSIKFQGLPHINWLKCSKQTAYYRVKLCATAFPPCRACPGMLPRSYRITLVIMPKVSSH